MASGSLMASVPVDLYNDLVDRERFLRALEAAGVDNWDGWETACQLYNGDITEEDI